MELKLVIGTIRKDITSTIYAYIDLNRDFY